MKINNKYVEKNKILYKNNSKLEPQVLIPII